MKSKLFSLGVVVVLIAISATSSFAAGSNYVNKNIVQLNASFSSTATYAESNWGGANMNNSSFPANSQISGIVVNSSKSSGSTGNIVVHLVAEIDGELWEETQPWSSSLTFNGFNGYAPARQFYVFFSSTRSTTGTIAAATLTGVSMRLNYVYP